MSEADAYARGAADVLGLVGQLAATDPTALVLLPANMVDLDRLAHAIAGIDHRQLWTLRPFDPAEAIAPKTAAGIAGRSDSCIRVWCDRYRIGRKVVGALCVSRPALAMLLDDNPPALAAYLCGDRSGPLVAPYFARCGLAA